MRKPRVHVHGGVYHVMLRGNNGQKIFNERLDEVIFFCAIEKTLAKCDAKIHAYCLMPNHVHLVVETGVDNISKVMQLIAGRYAQSFNSKYSRKGHLYQERFKSILISGDRYFLTVVRYIHQNPLRANLIKTLEDVWPSSFHDYFSDKKKSWLTTELAWKYFKNSSGNSKKEFKRFMGVFQTTEEYNHLYELNALPQHQSSNDFIKTEYLTDTSIKIKPLCSVGYVIIFCEKKLNVPRNFLINKHRDKKFLYARNITMSLAFVTKSASLKELSVKFKLSYAHMSQQINQTLRKNKTLMADLSQQLVEYFKS